MNKNVSRSAVKNNVFNKNQQQIGRRIKCYLFTFCYKLEVVNMGRRKKHKNTVKLLKSSSNTQKYIINHHHTHFNYRNVGSEHKTLKMTEKVLGAGCT